MSAYAIINFEDLDDVTGDAADRSGHFGRTALESRDLGVSLWTYGPNVRNTMAHSHKEQEEAYVVAEGSGRVLLDDEVRDLKRWDVVRVSPEVQRAFEAGPDGMTIVAVGGPKPEGGDGVRGDAEWPD
jgi:quercetin dioxygenase-like cupin family protein